ncbi:MAG: hypothetical protein JXB07_03510 [Anaerolineae bacterium]|nr:hypothetical protein [Anaerolineae bacterium]
MTITHGGINRRKRFDWYFDAHSKKVRIVNEDGREHSYSVQEIHHILNRLWQEFGDRYFPLANNVEYLSKGSEKMGLGMVILQQENSNVSHAQGASYLGVVLEECGYFGWNGKHRQIEWRFMDTDFSLAMIESRLTRSRSRG